VGAVVGAGFAVAEVGGPASVSVSGALLHGLVDLVAAVLEFDGHESASHGDDGSLLIGFLFLVGEGEAGALGAGVDA
jgi:hypothetical protein